MSVKRLLNQVVHAYFAEQQVLYDFLQLLCEKFYIFWAAFLIKSQLIQVIFKKNQIWCDRFDFKREVIQDHFFDKNMV